MNGISSLLSGISLLGFLAGILGIGLIVASTSQGRPVRGGVLLAAVGFVFGVLFSIISSGILIVEPTQVAVVTNIVNGQLEDPERRAGVSVLLPFIQTASLYNIRQQEYTMAETSSEGARSGDDAVDATTIDGQQVKVDITIIYAVDPTAANTLHLSIGPEKVNWENNFIRPTARTVVRNVIAKLPAEGIYGEQRELMQSQMREQMATEMATRGFIMNDFLVRGLQFGSEFAAAIEQKQIAEQRVQQASREAEQARTRAQGEADAAVTRAKGEADSAIERARGQAEALRLVSEQLAANPNLIQYEYIQNLSDNVRLILVPSNSPYLFDFNSLTSSADLAPGITAPTPEATPVAP